jgi:PadR family transcriptional regulator, regulatory protein AphA
VDPALGPSSFVILGIVAAAGPMTAYDLKGAIARSVGFLWPFPHAQVYKETARLASLGLLAEEQETGGRRRRRFAVTAAGRTAVGAWLAGPTHEPAQLRDPGLLKLAFASLGAAGDLERLCDEQAREHHARQAVYAGFADVPMDRFLRATLEFGLRHEELMVAAWERLREDLAGR